MVRALYAQTVTHVLPPPWEKYAEKLDKLEYVDAGEKLFSDPMLSKKNTISCATCHVPSRAFTNGLPTGFGLNGKPTLNNVPALFNKFDSTIQLWDGSISSLREQVLRPALDHDEMDMSKELILKRVNASAGYQKLFGKPITIEMIETALTNYILSLVSGGSKYDLYVAGDTTALTEEELAGKKLFFEVFHCDRCHGGNNFTNEKLEPRCGTTVSYGHSYKIPTLRNLKLTYPYLHNGRLNSIEEVLEFYNQPNTGDKGFSITSDEQKKLKLFLDTLNSDVRVYKRK
jgi:cytochrome c peroxidase